MDEQKLAELFRAAAADAPPATFDERDIAATSRRITNRRRSVMAGGSVAAGVVLAVGLVVGFGGFGHTGGSDSPAGMAAGVSGQSATAGANRAQPMMPNQELPTSTPKQGGEEGGETGSNPAGCGPTDGQLAAALANELPSVGAVTTVPSGITCPAGTRSAAYRVTGGTVGVLLIPANESGLKVSPSVATSPARTGSGTTLIVFSQPGSGPAQATAPEAGRLAAIATALAARF